MSLGLISYIKPNHNSTICNKTIDAIMKIKDINKFNILFKDKINQDLINILDKYSISWEDQVDDFWAIKMLDLINKNKATHYMLWEEDSLIYDSQLFDKTYKKMVDTDIDFMLTLDKKWIERAKFLYDNNIAIEDKDYYYFNWGTHYAKFCRENSKNKLVNGAYPVTASGVFKKELICNLLNDLISSTYWKKITRGEFTHFHNNPKLPHSFEVYDDFWWPPRGNGNIEYSTIINKMQFGKELGGRMLA